MNEIPPTFPDTAMPTIIPGMDIERPNTDVEMTYLENNNNNKAIRQKLTNNNVYEANIHKI